MGLTRCYKTTVFLHFIFAVSPISIHSWDATTSAFRKQTNVIWKFYILFRFGLFYRHLHAILQGRNNFVGIAQSQRELWRYVDFSRWRPYRRKYSYAFWFYHVSPPRRQRTICLLNISRISQSTAKLWLLLVAEVWRQTSVLLLLPLSTNSSPSSACCDCAQAYPILCKSDDRLRSYDVI